MMKIWRHIFLTNRVFYALGTLVFVLLSGFWWTPLFWAGLAGLLLLAVLLLVDGFLLFARTVPMTAQRHVPESLSLGHLHQVRYDLHYNSTLPLQGRLVEAWPAPLQRRNHQIHFSCKAHDHLRISAAMRPTTRGAYHFGVLQAFVRTPLGLVERSLPLAAAQTVAVYPNTIAMKTWELKALHRLSMPGGVKKMRRIGHSYEFEQIKNYVEGDDYRSINWKASGRRAELMVNQYEDERSQRVYALIDKSRAMHMPFEGMTLLDYAINTALVMANIALQKHDKAGLVTFHRQIDTLIPASHRRGHLRRILEQLYNEQTGTAEANYEALYHAVRTQIRGRSLLLLFTNFESHYALERVLPLLRYISHRHLLLVVFFENTTIRQVSESPVEDLRGIYTQTMAQHFIAEKLRMAQTLRQHGIQTILTPPDELSVHTVNKYVELKAKGMI